MLRQAIGTLRASKIPTISIFYGIVIYLYFFDNEKHNLPHIHARYQGQTASFSITDGVILSSDLPKAKWIEIHREDLMANWELGSPAMVVLSRPNEAKFLPQSFCYSDG